MTNGLTINCRKQLYRPTIEDFWSKLLIGAPTTKLLGRTPPPPNNGSKRYQRFRVHILHNELVQGYAGLKNIDKKCDRVACFIPHNLGLSLAQNKDVFLSSLLCITCHCQYILPELYFNVCTPNLLLTVNKLQYILEQFIPHYIFAAYTFMILIGNS